MLVWSKKNLSDSIELVGYLYPELKDGLPTVVQLERMMLSNFQDVYQGTVVWNGWCFFYEPMADGSDDTMCTVFVFPSRVEDIEQEIDTDDCGMYIEPPDFYLGGEH